MKEASKDKELFDENKMAGLLHGWGLKHVEGLSYLHRWGWHAEVKVGLDGEQILEFSDTKVEANSGFRRAIEFHYSEDSTPKLTVSVFWKSTADDTVDKSNIGAVADELRDLFYEPIMMTQCLTEGKMHYGGIEIVTITESEQGNFIRNTQILDDSAIHYSSRFDPIKE